jgi:hypothetical protein
LPLPGYPVRTTLDLRLLAVSIAHKFLYGNIYLPIPAIRNLHGKAVQVVIKALQRW